MSIRMMGGSQLSLNDSNTKKICNQEVAKVRYSAVQQVYADICHKG